MIWYGCLYQIAVGLLSLWMLKIAYFFIKRRYTPSSIVDQNSTEESDVYTSSENAFNESSSESFNLENEKELLCRLDQKKESTEILCKNKTMDINNVTECSGYGFTADEMMENHNYSTSQNVLNTCNNNSDSHSSIISWESCNKEISHPELDFVNSLFSENHTETCQPLNLCIRDKKNETETNKTTRTFFTDRKYKSTKGIQKINSEKYLFTEIMKDPNFPKEWDKMKTEFDILKHTERSFNSDQLKNLDCFENIEYTLNNDKVEYNLDYTEHELKNENNLVMTKISSIHHDEYCSLDNTDYELKNENHLEITKLSSIYHGELEDAYSLDHTKHELKLGNNLEITEISSIHSDDCSLDNTEHGIKLENHLEFTKLSSIHNDDCSLDNTEHELKLGNNLEITELFSIHNDDCSLDNTEHGIKLENNLEFTKLSSIHNDDCSLDNTEHELKLGNNLEITELFSIHNDDCSLDNTEHGIKLENNLEFTKLSSIYNDDCSLDYTEHELNLRNNLEITELSSIYHNELENKYNLDNTERELKDENNLEIIELSSEYRGELEDEYNLEITKHSLDDDEMMLGNDLEITKLSSIHQDGQHDENNLESLELSSLNNDKSISGIDSPNMKFNHVYEDQDSQKFNNISSSECTESFPSPIFNNDSSVDDIRYVEDYNDISFFGSTFSDDAMNEAFVED